MDAGSQGTPAARGMTGPALPRRLLGTTGQAVSVVGFGAFKIGRNQGIKYSQGYDLPDEATVTRLLDGVLELGINHIDTAPAYGLSEERVGRCLGHRRDEFFLSTKVGEEFADGVSQYRFDEASVRSSVERSLRRLRTGHLDLVLVHAPGNDLEVLRQSPVVETLQALQRAGDVRWIGFSGKTVAAAEAALDWAQVLMVEYHRDDVSHQAVLAEAQRRGVGVLVKKGLASGRLPAAEAIPFVLRTPGVTNLVIGGLSLAHLAENVAIATRAVSD
jgi:aryl-alcohol dehydrogenase-like predicted oxidoreductase